MVFQIPPPNLAIFGWALTKKKAGGGSQKFKCHASIPPKTSPYIGSIPTKVLKVPQLLGKERIISALENLNFLKFWPRSSEKLGDSKLS